MVSKRIFVAAKIFGRDVDSITFTYMHNFTTDQLFTSVRPIQRTIDNHIQSTRERGLGWGRGIGRERENDSGRPRERERQEYRENTNEIDT